MIMYKKHFKIIISVLWVTAFLLVVLSCKPLIRMFKKEKHFSYNDVKYIGIKYVDENVIDISDPDDIKLILEHLNSLELIEEKIPYNEQALYLGNFEEYENKLREIGYFLITISNDMIEFTTEYAAVSTEGRYDENHYKSYYIKNSGFNAENKTSNFYNFLREISNKYL